MANDKHSESAVDRICETMRAFNSDPNRPFDEVGGQKVYHRARWPILATDCDYEIVSVSGVQGKRLPVEQVQ